MIDDEEFIASSIARILRRQHDVVGSTNGKLALARFDAGERFDVVFCDMIMPGMSGPDFHAALLERFPDQAERIVFLTGDAFTSSVTEFLAKVGNFHLEKPFETDALLTVVNARVSAQCPAG